MRSRFYKAEIGRFIQRDTYAGNQNDPLSLNRYTYCQNEPLMYHDPAGMASQAVTNIYRREIIEFVPGSKGNSYIRVMGGKKGKTVIDILREGKDYEIINGTSYFLPTTHVKSAKQFSSKNIIKAGNNSVYLTGQLNSNGLKKIGSGNAKNGYYVTATNKYGNKYIFREDEDFLLYDDKARVTFTKNGEMTAPISHDTMIRNILWYGTGSISDSQFMNMAAEYALYWQDGIHRNNPNYSKLSTTKINRIEAIGTNNLKHMSLNSMMAAANTSTVGGNVKPSKIETPLIKGEGGKLYTPANPGPLKESVANTFNGGTYTEMVLTQDTVMYRVYGGSAGKVGSFLSRTPQGGGLQSQLDLALDPSWGNTATQITKVVIPKGTVIYEGVAAPQSIKDSLGNTIGILQGGGNQIYIPKVEAGWFR